MELLHQLNLLPPWGLLDSGALKKAFDCGATTLWKLQQENPDFPKPVVGIDSKKRWRVSDIKRFVENLAPVPDTLPPGRKPITAKLAQHMNAMERLASASAQCAQEAIQTSQEKT